MTRTGRCVRNLLFHVARTRAPITAMLSYMQARRRGWEGSSGEKRTTSFGNASSRHLAAMPRVPSPRIEGT
eukprot:2362345-Rhodomonas_salina.2